MVDYSSQRINMKRQFVTSLFQFSQFKHISVTVCLEFVCKIHLTKVSSMVLSIKKRVSKDQDYAHMEMDEPDDLNELSFEAILV